jgi:hypothetical protein
VRDSKIPPLVIVEGQLNFPPPWFWRPIEFPPSMISEANWISPLHDFGGQLNFPPALLFFVQGRGEIQLASKIMKGGNSIGL